MQKTLPAAALVVMLVVGAFAQTEKILYSFTGGSDGSQPLAGLTFDSKGNLYGTAFGGGTSNSCVGCGTVFELSPNSNGSWTQKVLYSFDFTDDVANPVGNVVFDSKGNLYGATLDGGNNIFGGAVFQLSPSTNGVWTEKVLHIFGETESDGYLSYSGVVLDGAGNLYGTTLLGGTLNSGIAFQLVPATDGSWTENILHTFAYQNDGAPPFENQLTTDGAGNVYGLALGGAHDYGLVYELTRGSNGNWTDKILHAFTGGAGGSLPHGGLTFDAAGNLYGVSDYSIFELTPGTNGTWTQKILHNFAGGSDGAYPQAQLIFDNAGNLYGTTSTGGSNLGTVFELSPGKNGTWTERVLHKFTGGSDGSNPSSALVVDAHGNVYGTTANGGTSGEGSIFEITP